MKHKDIFFQYYPFILLMMGGLIVIELLVGTGQLPQFIIPSPTLVGKALITQRTTLWNHSLVTLLEVIIGLGLSIGLGLPLGILMHYYSWINRAVYPFILISQTIPIIALSPIFVMWFGYGIMIKIAVIFLFCFFPLVVSMYDGLKSTDAEQIAWFNQLTPSKRKRFIYLEWHMALPAVLSGIKLSVIYALMGAAVGEWLGGSDGLGYYIRRAASNLKSEGVFAGIVILSCIGLILFGLVTLIETHLLVYRQTERKSL